MGPVGTVWHTAVQLHEADTVRRGANCFLPPGTCAGHVSFLSVAQIAQKGEPCQPIHPEVSPSPSPFGKDRDTCSEGCWEQCLVRALPLKRPLALAGSVFPNSVHEAHVDQKNKVVSTPAFMCETALHHIHDGIGAMVTQVLELARK